MPSSASGLWVIPRALGPALLLLGSRGFLNEKAELTVTVSGGRGLITSGCLARSKACADERVHALAPGGQGPVSSHPAVAAAVATAAVTGVHS